MVLERFQDATVRAALKAFGRRSGSRRFLIADEVGLGKTVTAREIAVRLQRKNDGPLNIVYLCPNLDIATQNLNKLKTLATDWEQPEDRLSLVLEQPIQNDKTAFRIYCFTPETSLPGWRVGQRTGRIAERQLIARLIAKMTPMLWRRVRIQDREREKQGLARRFPARPGAPPKHLLQPFECALREVMELTKKPFERELVAWFSENGEDTAELILRARAALALTALHHPLCRPDLLILDEFHRFADLIIPSGNSSNEERERVHRLIVDALIGESGNAPALLLLSATPYRLQRLDRREIPGGRHGHFAALVRFLYGKAGAGPAAKVETAITAHYAALERRDDRDKALGEVAAAKQMLEELLRPVIARTERATAIAGELFARRNLPAPIEKRDLVTFRHLARAVDAKAPHLNSWVPPLWSSVPYPAETLFNYRICTALGRNLPSATITTGKESPAHPRLRALVKDEGRGGDATLDCSALGLPWLAPTLPWWRLGGRWSSDLVKTNETRRTHGKALVFSRYRGTPAAVGAWLSAEVDRRSSRRKIKGRFSAQAYLRPDAEAPWPLIALFLPWPTLSEAFEPQGDGNRSSGDVRRWARMALRDWLEAKKLTITPNSTPARKAWRLAFDLEGLLGDPARIDVGLRDLGDLVPRGAWRRENVPPTVSKREADMLADLLLEAPGAIVARTLRRHDPKTAVDAEVFLRRFRFCWRQLRQYLGQRYFAGTILGQQKRRRKGGYPEALRQAMVDGGFEAVLDEHMAVMMLIGDLEPIQVLEESLVGRPGRVQRRTTRGLRHARVHAAVPYLGADRKTTDRSEKLRSDMLRKGFNSPFWPHVLVTTSIGQEGLDFHVWCDRVIHWDLPRDPVDFEQREGRISRYASLCVRRALVEKYNDKPRQTWESPFKSIFTATAEAKGQGLGLERWWSPADHQPVSVTFSQPFSVSELQIAQLQKDLVRYRLALGQPEPQLFEAMVRHFELGTNQVRELALNLSPTVSTR
ncbi:MAG TPA: hypothetical protein DD670_03785 [Planctomycetaceae bacterium]|nr:hypothetical protein [Planctomycetaceae bacterium]